MLRIALRGFGARRMRVALTALSVALGVALIAGTYVLTDTINRSFDKIFQNANAHTDVALSPKATFKDDGDSSASPTIPESVLRRVERVGDVAEAGGGIFSQVVILKADGKRVGSHGPPNFISSLRPRRFEAFSFVQGRKPATDREAALNRSTAERAHIRIGDTIKIVAAGPATSLKVVGLTEFAGAASFGGASAAVTTLATAQRLTGKQGRFDSIDVAAKPGVSAVALKREIRAVTPPTVRVETGKEDAARQSKDIRDNLSFLRTALLAFAFISLFVGAFLIFNTFSITVAQRTREFGLLRTLGAKRRQVLRSVIVEALVLGAVGALAGLGLGIALAPGLKALFKAIGADLPSSGMVLATRTIVVSLVIGIVVTLLSSLAPAFRATRVPPIAALREGAILPRGRFARFSIPFAILVTLAGAVLLGIGLFGGLSSSGALSLIGIGSAALFIGVALLTPKLVPPIAAVVGAPLPGVVGRLARENAVRLPGRTAVTAAALMIGVALVAFASIFAAGFRASLDQAVDNALTPGAFIVQNTDGFSPIPRGSTAAIATVSGVRAVSPVTFSRGKVGTTKVSVSAIDPATFASAYKAKLKSGRLGELGPRTALVQKGYADKHHVKVGDTLRVLTPSGRRVPLTVRGITDDKGRLLADLTVTAAVAHTQFGERDIALNFVTLQPGASGPRTQKAIDRLLNARFPVAEVLTAQEFKDRQAGQINQLLGLIYALLALSVIVSLFGIVNTLVLSIHERIRELGMLRAIGASRRQVRRMVRYEAVITSMIGAIVGIALGSLLAIAVAQPLDSQGFVLSFPVATLLTLLVLAALAGVVTAIGPARRAARIDVLRALAYE